MKINKKDYLYQNIILIPYREINRRIIFFKIK